MDEHSAKRIWERANALLATDDLRAHGILKRFRVTALCTTDDPADVEKVWDRYTKANTYERVPYVLAAAVQYIISHPVDEQLGAQLRAFDFHKVIDNGTVDRLVKEGFFEQLFGPGIKAEEESKAKAAFR